jgi:hypothetical protein
VEAGRSFIRYDYFLCDPEGATCMSLHFFTNFSAMFTSDTKNGQKRDLFACPYFKEDAGSGIEQSPGYHPVVGLPQRCGR